MGITNGNVHSIFCGLENYSIYIFHAGKDEKFNPYGDMYYLSDKELGLSCRNILHISDNLGVDVKGWLFLESNPIELINIFIISIFYFMLDEQYVPHVKIASLLSLINLCNIFIIIIL